MVIRSVSVTRLRNHVSSRIECASALTIISGANGAGKTSILEAISLCAIAKTFVPVQDSSVIQFGFDDCMASVEATSDREVPYNVQIELRRGTKKRIQSNHGGNLNPKDIIGELPIVALSPDHKSITLGAPQDRRAFVDAVMAQSSKRYTELLYEHRRILKQRNILLDTVRSHGVNDTLQAELDTWTKMMIEVSANIVNRRSEFLLKLEVLVREFHATVSSGAEEIKVEYQPDNITLNADTRTIDLETARIQFGIQAGAVGRQEFSRGTTVFGPQKDEISLLINNMAVRDSASQGQHKSLLVSLKLAECVMLNETLSERPVVLLDDVFAELDAERCLQVMDIVVKMGMQCFVTTTNSEDILRLFENSAHTNTELYALRNSNEICVRNIEKLEAA
ncbi:MAG: DNA replication/repair protein RecF [Ignavibacteria bacterium]|nr:DNA replication/repair protein RecF [Ignavibacteria bacterium]